MFKENVLQRKVDRVQFKSTMAKCPVKQTAQHSGPKESFASH